jgi:hypothetical protein
MKRCEETWDEICRNLCSQILFTTSEMTWNKFCSFLVRLNVCCLFIYYSLPHPLPPVTCVTYYFRIPLRFVSTLTLFLEFCTLKMSKLIYFWHIKIVLQKCFLQKLQEVKTHKWRHNNSSASWFYLRDYWSMFSIVYLHQEVSKCTYRSTSAPSEALSHEGILGSAVLLNAFVPSTLQEGHWGASLPGSFTHKHSPVRVFKRLSVTQFEILS